MIHKDLIFFTEKSNTVVKVNTFIRSINDIDDYKMEFSVQITFREQWNDMRLKFDDAEGKLSLLISLQILS